MYLKKNILKNVLINIFILLETLVLKDTYKPIIYWVHFSGRDVVDTLHHYNITTNQNIFYVDVNLVLSTLFRQIINELQLRT